MTDIGKLSGLSLTIVTDTDEFSGLSQTIVTGTEKVSSLICRRSEDRDIVKNSVASALNLKIVTGIEKCNSLCPVSEDRDRH